MPNMWQLVLLLAVLPGAYCDLPVHCLRHQIDGEWEFTLGALSKQRTSCGHQRPDIESVQPQGVDGSLSKKKITLSEPNVAKSGTGSAGTYTMVYDEGFEVTIDGHVFFAFSKFDSGAVNAGNQTENGKHSHCGETARGWYRDQSRSMWGCYKATKVHQSISLLAIAPQAKPLSRSYDRPRSLDWHTKRVKHLNMMQLSWSARVYHRFVGKTMRELNTYAGIQRTLPRQHQRLSGLPRRNAFLEIDQETCPELPTVKKARPGEVLGNMMLKGQKPLKPCQLKKQLQTFSQPVDALVLKVEKSLPKTFSWSKARGGRNFLEPVMDQADCGSCYVVSTTRMLTARHKISTNNTAAEPWSISFPLHCAEYNQGCKGGYGFLASKWSEDIGLIPASCAPYNTSGTCGSTCDPKKMKKRYHAANHHLVGGFYGNSSSVPMMLELHKNGPLVVSFEPSEDFMMYSGGIFSTLELSVPAPLLRSGTEWQKVDHAVLLVGWGEDDGQKYWLVQNSWGTDWGESGYFRIARDINDCGVESQAEGAEVVEDDHPEVLADFLEQNQK